jgi:hypothetical protein
MTKIQMSKTKPLPHFIATNILFSLLEHLYFVFVSGFEIRISNFHARLNAQNSEVFLSHPAIGQRLV